MSRRRSAAKGRWQIILLLVAALVLWLFDVRPQTPAAGGRVEGGYERFDGCRLVAHRQNDGDSFRVKLPDGRVEEFRLYFVDAPESAFRSYAGGRNNHDRIADQARYFGVTPERAVEIGRRAKDYSLGLLGAGEFTIHTAWDDPFGDRRYHAFVALPGGGWLHGDLVREGLARLHTKGTGLPDGTPESARRKKLRELEREARRQRKGGWAPEPAPSP